jgi:hypothetical protein
MTYHAIERAREHYGFDLSFGDLREIAGICLDGKSIYSVNYNGNIEMHKLVWRGTRIAVLCIPEELKVITFLTPLAARPEYVQVPKAVYVERQRQATMRRKHKGSTHWRRWA